MRRSLGGDDARVDHRPAALKRLGKGDVVHVEGQVGDEHLVLLIALDRAATPPVVDLALPLDDDAAVLDKRAVQRACGVPGVVLVAKVHKAEPLHLVALDDGRGDHTVWLKHAPKPGIIEREGQVADPALELVVDVLALGTRAHATHPDPSTSAQRPQPGDAGAWSPRVRPTEALQERLVLGLLLLRLLRVDLGQVPGVLLLHLGLERVGQLVHLQLLVRALDLRVARLAAHGTERRLERSVDQR